MDYHKQFAGIRTWLTQTIIGQKPLCESLLITLLADGHLLAEGPPGVAKTLAVRALSACLDATFSRIQFTPDLMPADLTGTDVFQPQNGTFTFIPGPLFNNLVLADEINRAPAGVQSALLEAMAEKQITTGTVTRTLPEPFVVMATRNNSDCEGTSELPVAQLDRFILSVQVPFPSACDEKLIVRDNRRKEPAGEADFAYAGLNGTDKPRITPQMLQAARHEIKQIHIAPAVEDYIIRLTGATRHETGHGSVAALLEHGAGPRATIALDRCARTRAWLGGRDFVSPEDVRALAPGVLRHRLTPSFSAQAAGHTRDMLLARLLNLVPVC